MRFSHETSARWSVDGSQNYNYSYSRTFMAVTPCYRPRWAGPEPTTHAQPEFAIFKDFSICHRFFVALLRQSFRGPGRRFLAILLPPFFSPRLASVLKPGGRFRLHHLHQALDQETPPRLHGVRLVDQDAHVRRRVQALCTWWLKGEELSPEDEALEKKLLRPDQSSTAPITMEEDTKEEFLSNIRLYEMDFNILFSVCLPVFTHDYIYLLRDLKLFTLVQILAKLSPGTHKYK